MPESLAVPAANPVSKAEYARRKGVSRQAVHKALEWRIADALLPDGRINADLADKLWQDNTHPCMGKNRGDTVARPSVGPKPSALAERLREAGRQCEASGHIPAQLFTDGVLGDGTAPLAIELDYILTETVVGWQTVGDLGPEIETWTCDELADVLERLETLAIRLLAVNEGVAKGEDHSLASYADLPPVN